MKVSMVSIGSGWVSMHFRDVNDYQKVHKIVGEGNLVHICNREELTIQCELEKLAHHLLINNRKEYLMGFFDGHEFDESDEILNQKHDELQEILAEQTL